MKHQNKIRLLGSNSGVKHKVKQTKLRKHTHQKLQIKNNPGQNKDSSVIYSKTPDKKRGGPNDPFSRLIGKFNGPHSGSQNYKQYIYGFSGTKKEELHQLIETLPDQKIAIAKKLLQSLVTKKGCCWRKRRP